MRVLSFLKEKMSLFWSLYRILFIVSLSLYMHVLIISSHPDYFTGIQFIPFPSFFSPAQIWRHRLGVGPQPGFGVSVGSYSPKGWWDPVVFRQWSGAFWREQVVRNKPFVALVYPFSFKSEWFIGLPHLPLKPGWDYTVSLWRLRRLDLEVKPYWISFPKN